MSDCNYRRGDDSHSSKLTEKRVRIARKHYEQAKKIAERYSCKAMAERFGVAESTVRSSVKGVTWRHVK